MLRVAVQKRFSQLVTEHLSTAQPLAAGPRALPGPAKAFSSTQAAWRFYRHPQYRMAYLIRPLLESARQAVHEDCSQFVLAVHDWSNIHLKHESKKDRIELSNHQDWGYHLQSCLLVGDRNGEPLAPVFLGLQAADGVHCTHSWALKKPLSNLDSVQPVMELVAEQNYDKPVVHIIDAEADSVFHYRCWTKSPGFLILVRADDRNVEHQGQEQKISQLHEQLLAQNEFRFSREVEYHGKPALQFVAEAAVTLKGPAYRNQRGKSRHSQKIPGPPVDFRLVISEVRNAEGKVLAVWYLLTNVPAQVTSSTVALWCYWRWRIETYFKLLKSAGQQLEHWQQETAEAFARRLVVASMACVLVWRLARSTAPEADKLRDVLIRLSGRQMKRNKRFTEPALLAGLWVLLSMLALLEQHDPEELRQWLQASLTAPRPPPRNASKKM